MKKEMLKKMAKAASVALVSGVMLCGAGLAANTSASANGVPGLSTAESVRLSHFSNKKANSVLNAYNNTYTKTHSNKKAGKAAHAAYEKLIAHKSGKKTARKANKAAAHEEKGIRAGKYNSHKLGAVKKSNKKARKHAKKSLKRSKKAYKKAVAKRARKAAAKRAKLAKNTKRANALRRAKAARRNARRSLRRRAVKPMNKKAYRAHRRAVKNFRQSRYYHEVWSSAEKTNQRAVRLDQKRLNKTVKANNSKHLTKYEHRALNRSIKAQQRHISYMNSYVNHDAHMLSLAK